MKEYITKKHPTGALPGDNWLMGDEYGTWLAIDGEWYEVRYIIELVEPIIVSTKGRTEVSE